jgi:hypothetical protein
MKKLLLISLTAIVIWSTAGSLLPHIYRVEAEEADMSVPEYSGPLGRVAYSAWGTLALVHENGVTRLRGILEGGGNCGGWDTEVYTHQNPGVIIFELTPRTDPGVICLQATSAKEAVGAGIPATGQEFFIIKVGDEVVFEGKLDRTGVPVPLI